MIRKFLCFLAVHKFSEPEQILNFETLFCKHCGRKWAVNTDNQTVWEITPR